MSITLIDRQVGAAVAGALVAGATLAVLAKQALPLSGLYPLKVAFGLVVVGWLLLRATCRGGESDDVSFNFGAADHATLLRAVLAILLLGLFGEDSDARLLWSAFAIAAAAAASDALDGWIARRTGTVSDFGARFDMETDAALIAVLALLVWYWERAGAWVLIAGAARYVFVLGGYCCRWMRRELPPSRRRKVVCAAQVVALVGCLAPPLAPAHSALIAALGVGALLGSFIVDTLWLGRAAHDVRMEMKHVDSR